MKRAFIACGLALATVVLASSAGWAYQEQIWLRDDYTKGYAFGSTTPTPGHSSCQEAAEAHSSSLAAQVVYRGGCEDAAQGRDPRPEATGGFVSDALGLWGPFG